MRWLVALCEYGEQGECVHTFSSVGMVSLSLAIRLDTCSMPRLRNSSLPTTSGKCCSGHDIQRSLCECGLTLTSFSPTCSRSVSSKFAHPVAVQLFLHTNLRSCWPAWGAESRRAGQQRLVFPGSWMDGAESSGTRNKPFSLRSAGAGQLQAAMPVKHTQTHNIEHKVVVLRAN